MCGRVFLLNKIPLSRAKLCLSRTELSIFTCHASERGTICFIYRQLHASRRQKSRVSLEMKNIETHLNYVLKYDLKIWNICKEKNIIKSP